ncbi:MAG: MBL fold metallo-hydrolase [Chloroflexi bacterium]|nr:MBL fold metallo-hydrolase [Chloroflexota bacterium]
MLRIGDISIHLINDGDILVDGGGAFGLVPRALWKHILPPDDENLVPMKLTNLLVQVGGKNIVVDTGLGQRLNERGRKIWHLDQSGGGLVGGLARLGLSPADIHLVIDTHLHADHCAGNMTYDAEGKLRPTFPNAEYVVQQREYADAMRPNERTRATYIADNFHPLVESGQMRLLNGDSELATGVWGVVTSGHTPGHMSVRFESGGKHALFTCDLASYAVHFERLGWMTAYDVEPLVTLENKRKWQAWALETDALLIFPHEPQHPVGRLMLDGKIPKIIPVEETHS